MGGRVLTTIDEDDVEALIEPLEVVAGRRVRHVVLENARVRATVEALISADGADLGAIHDLFLASHVSLRDDFEVTVPETDLLVELCLEAGAVAARMTGGGFGGAVVALTDPGAGARVERIVLDGYHARQSQWEGMALRCSAAEGAGRR